MAQNTLARGTQHMTFIGLSIYCQFRIPSVCVRFGATEHEARKMRSKSTNGQQHAMPCIGSVLNTNCNDDFDFATVKRVLCFVFILAGFSFSRSLQNTLAARHRRATSSDILCIIRRRFACASAFLNTNSLILRRREKKTIYFWHSHENRIVNRLARQITVSKQNARMTNTAPNFGILNSSNLKHYMEFSISIFIQLDLRLFFFL